MNVDWKFIGLVGAQKIPSSYNADEKAYLINLYKIIRYICISTTLQTREMDNLNHTHEDITLSLCGFTSSPIDYES